MFSVANKSIAAAILMLGMCACGNSAREGAEELYKQSESAIEARNYSGAIVLLDTLNSRYPAETGIRREALRLRARAMEGIAQDSIQAGDKALAEATIRREELDAKFRHVDSSVGLEGYFIPKGAPEKVMTATGIQPRVTDKGYFYIVANVQGRAIGLRSISFVNGAETCSSSEISPSRVIKVEGSESCSFNPEDLEGVGQWLKDHPDASKVVLVGTKGNADVKLTKELKAQLVECYDYACALQAQRLASIHREKYERMLATARDQLANLPVPETKDK